MVLKKEKINSVKNNIADAKEIKMREKTQKGKFL